MKTSTCQTTLGLMTRMRGRCPNPRALRKDIHIEVCIRFAVSMRYAQTWCGGFGNGLLLSTSLKHGEWHQGASSLTPRPSRNPPFEWCAVAQETIEMFNVIGQLVRDKRAHATKASCGIRTHDLPLTKRVLCQLS